MLANQHRPTSALSMVLYNDILYAVPNYVLCDVVHSGRGGEVEWNRVC